MRHYRIYQADINTGRAFKSLAEIGKPKSRDYVMVFESTFTLDEASDDTDIEVLEELFRIFNKDEKPEGFFARSMSMSDIVELYDDENPESCGQFYYCDMIGFNKVEFDSSEAENSVKTHEGI